jgi:uncharacterized protein
MDERPLPVTLLRSVLWRRLDVPAWEHSRLQEFPDGYIIDGRVLTVLDGQPAEAHYGVLCGLDWTTRHAHVTLIHGADARRIQLRRDEQDHWWHDEQRVPDLDGLVDVDLALTPVTNTLPIRRLALDIGGSAATTAAWIRFPELTVEPLPQRYTRLDAHRYRYESRRGAFTAELDGR